MPFGALLGGLDIPNAILAPSPSERKPQNPLGVVFSRRRRDPWCGSPSPPHRLSTVPDRRWHRVAPVRTRAAWPRLAGRSASPPCWSPSCENHMIRSRCCTKAPAATYRGSTPSGTGGGVASTCTQPPASAVVPSPERPPARARSCRALRSIATRGDDAP